MKKTLKKTLFGFVLCAVGVAALGAESGATVLQDTAAGLYHREGARFALEGRLEEAVAAFTQAVALDPKNGGAYYSLGNVYSELGRWTDAVAAYRKAVSLNSSDVEAYNGLGIALSRRGAYEQAAAAFEKAIKIYPKWAEPHYHLSQVYRKLGRDADARASYDRAVLRRPDYSARPPRTFMTVEAVADVEPRGERAATAGNAVASGAERPAASVARPKDTAAPRDNATPRAATPDARPPVAVAPPPARQPAAVPAPSATATAERAARPTPEGAGDYYNLGVRHSRIGRYEEAVAAFRQSISLDRNNAATYSALGNAYAELGRWPESVDAYEQAVRLNPKDAAAYEGLGRSYVKLRETTPPAAGGVREAAGGVRAAAAPEESADTAARRTSTAPPASDADPTAVYRVGAGDVLDVRVLDGRASQTTSYKVTPAGLLDHPLLDKPLEVTGLTADEIAARLSAELKQRAVAPDPRVAVGVREYASHAVIISGLVTNPGTKILRREGVPLYVIVAHAQPLPAAGRVQLVSHATGRSADINISDARAMDVLVRPGDVINVRARAEQYFYIAGAVREPGQKEFHAGLTLTQAVLAAGGVSSTGARVVTIARQGADGRLATTRHDLKDIGAGRVPDPAVRQGDRIEVWR